MRHTLLSLDPLREASWWAVIDHHLARLRTDPANAERPSAELQIDAVLDSGEPATRVPEVVVHVDVASWCHGRHDDTPCETIDGTPIPVATVQRLCCEAVIQAVLVHPDGTVDRLCAEQRTANRAQRHLLAAMYSTCAHPHCQIPFSQCRIHHLVWWTNGGRTILENLLPVCEAHHHLVHEGGWTLRMNHHRHVTRIRPDGTVWHTDTGPNRPPPTRTRDPDPPPVEPTRRTHPPDHPPLNSSRAGA